MKAMRIHSVDRNNKDVKNVPKEIPMSLLDERQAYINHGQTLLRLNERGGMGVVEILDNIHKRRLSFRKETQQDVDELNAIITTNTPTHDKRRD